jgi:alkyl hydroperoxide reductase subunit AhpC
MATLTLTRPNICFDARLTNATALVDWLQGAWGLVFSHPQDFATMDLEADRWRYLVHASLDAANVRALRLHSSEQGFTSWIEQMTGAAPWLVLERRKRVSSEDFAARAGALRSELARATGRFVAVLDDDMRLRRTFAYEAGQRLPSLFDLIAYAELLRKQTTRRSPVDRGDEVKVIDLRRRAPSLRGAGARAAHALSVC